jgi:hypothetical protein
MNLGTRPTAEEVKAMLGLEPHPTCGFVAEPTAARRRSPLRRCPKPTRVIVHTALPCTSSSPPTPRSSCTGYVRTNSTITTWEIPWRC